MPAPPSLSKEGLEVAASLVGNHYQPVVIAPEDRIRHIYIVGQTGTGKTTMLKSMIGSDLKSGRGICVIDPHGDLFRWTLAQIPDERMEDVVLLDPADKEFPVGLNMLECPDESQRHFLVQEMTGIVSRIMQDEHGQAAQEWMGPVFLQHVRMNLLLVMSDPETPGTLVDFYDIFVEKDSWKRWLPLKTADPQLEKWVAQVLPRTDYFKTSEGSVFGGYFSSKFEQFVFDPILRNIFGQRYSTINFRELMDQGQILLVNLAKGELSDICSRFLGMVVLAKLQAAAMGRVRVPLEQRRPFFVYVDEFQNIATQSFISMLSEGRKFGLGLVLANQFVSQLEDRRIVESIFGNVGTLISFRVGQPDAEVLEKYFYPVFSRSDLISLPNWHSVMSTLANGQTVQPFSIETKLMLSEYDYSRAERVREQSRRKYAATADKSS
jgi:type IV secretory pathway TraG/TraD family ATPase VirD4